MLIPKNSQQRRRSAALAAVVVLLVFLAAGCRSQPPQISIDGQYAELSPVFFGVGSVFMTIRNSGGGDAVTGITVNVPGALVELHDVKDRRMVKVEKIAVPAHGNAELKPGGMHIMLMGLKHPLKRGEHFSVTLTFAHAPPITTQVEVAKIGAAGPDMMQMRHVDEMGGNGH